MDEYYLKFNIHIYRIIRLSFLGISDTFLSIFDATCLFVGNIYSQKLIFYAIFQTTVARSFLDKTLALSIKLYCICYLYCIYP